MTDEINKISGISKDPNFDQVVNIMEKIFSTAHISAIFCPPITSGNYTIITAGEVSNGGGGGRVSGPPPASAKKGGSEEVGQAIAFNSGAVGGGGGSMGRPIATIIIGPDGVKVEPIVDATKIAITALTTISAIILASFKVRRAGKVRTR